MVKTRVSTRFKSAVGKSHNKSEDLKQLTEKYEAFNKCLKSFIGVLKQHYSAMEALTKSRVEMAQHITVLARGSPLSNHVAAMPEAGAPPDSVCSYLSTHHALANKNKQFAQRFAKFVIDYCIQWQQVVFTRIERTLKEAEQSRVEADHYQSKVESLRQSANEKLAKGKQVDSKSAEKLTRNEEKLVSVKEANRKKTADACLLVEELTDRGWRDLHPLLVKVIQFDMTISTEEAKATGSLKAVVTELKNIAATHGISEDARLKEIETLAPQDLSTREEGDVVQVEADMGRLSFTSGNSSGGMMNQGSNMHFASGPAPQGFGFPVPVKRSDGLGGMSTVDMVAISAAAAPPPSMDQLEAAFGSSDSSLGSEISAPPVAAPPLPPSDTNPFGPSPTHAAAPSIAPNPFGPGPTSTTPSMYGGAPASTNPFGAPALSPFGAPPTPASSTNPFADPTPAYTYPPPSPYAATPPMAPPTQQYGGQQQMVPMYSNGGISTPIASGYGLSQPYPQQAYDRPQQRPTSSNPFD